MSRMPSARWRTWALGGMLCLLACRSPVGARLPPRETPGTRSSATALGPGDVFAVRVFGETDLTGDYRVGDDGTIDFPYLHRLQVSGLQASDVADMIQRGLREQQVLRDPHVSVYLREVVSRRVSVFGQVQHPGVFPHQQEMTVTQAISQAGGFTAIADKNRVRVTRRGRDGRQQTFVLRVEDIGEGRAQDFDLQPGDVIFVPESIT